jgi:hypothetical protein
MKPWHMAVVRDPEDNIMLWIGVPVFPISSIMSNLPGSASTAAVDQIWLWIDSCPSTASASVICKQKDNSEQTREERTCLKR